MNRRLLANHIQPWRIRCQPLIHGIHRRYASQASSPPRVRKILQRIGVSGWNKVRPKHPEMENLKTLLLSPKKAEAANRLHEQIRADVDQTESAQLAQMLHECVRKSQSREQKLELFHMARRMAKDWQSGTVIPQDDAVIHVMGICKEERLFEEGKELWQYLARQDDSVISTRVYGAAIELLAASGEKLDTLEALFNEALERYLGNFAAYHMSPNAILLDRNDFNHKVQGTSMALLQAIITARIMLGDVKNAYIAFDTALRLSPTMSTRRLFQLFIENRPVEEAYKVFHMACRARNLSHPSTLTWILDKLSGPQHRFPRNAAEIKQRIELLGCSTDAIRAWVGAGGEFDWRHLSVLIKAITKLIPWSPAKSQPDEHWLRYTQIVTKTTEDFFLQHQQSLTRSGVPPESGAFTCLMLLAGSSRDPAMASRVMQNLFQQALPVRIIVQRVLLKVCGLCGQMEEMKKAWLELAQHVSEDGETLQLRDWQALTSSASFCQDPRAFDFAEDQANLHGGSMLWLVQNVRNDQAKMDGMLPSITPDEYSALSTAFTRVSDELKLMAPLHDFYKNPFSTDLPGNGPLGSKEEIRKIYDEMTTDPANPARPATPTSLRTKADIAGFPYSEHRFEHWNNLNELLVLAEGKIAKQPEARGTRSRRPLAMANPELPEKKKEAADSIPTEDLRKYIRRLRGMQ